ncbi:hypothetical protein LI328DRAFT_122943 [Trichoderma asperelloides]|nr:hypothetical protein LI328DRAFT_122943 [Trichoderma asperelloides]
MFRHSIPSHNTYHTLLRHYLLICQPQRHRSTYPFNYHRTNCIPTMIRQHKVFSFLDLMTMSPCGRQQKHDQRIGRASCFQLIFFYETFSTNTLAAAEVDDVMVNHLNLGESQHDTITGVSWKSGVGSFLLLFFVTITVPDISFLLTYSSFCVRICEGGSLFLHAKVSGIFLEEFIGVFPQTQRPNNGRFCCAWTGSILKPGLWIMVCLSLGGGGRGSGDSACVTGSGNQEGPMEAASFVNKTSS